VFWFSSFSVLRGFFLFLGGSLIGLAAGAAFFDDRWQTKTKSTTKTNTKDIPKHIRTRGPSTHRYSHLQSIKFRRRTREVFLPAHSVRFERFSSAERLTRTERNPNKKKKTNDRKRETKSKKITSSLSQPKNN